MSIFSGIISVIIIAFILQTVLMRLAPAMKRKHVAMKPIEDEPREMSDKEIALRRGVEYYQQRLQRLSTDGAYEKVSYGTVFNADTFGKVMSEKSAIEQRLRDINRELMELKGRS